MLSRSPRFFKIKVDVPYVTLKQLLKTDFVQYQRTAVAFRALLV